MTLTQFAVSTPVEGCPGVSPDGLAEEEPLQERPACPDSGAFGRLVRASRFACVGAVGTVLNLAIMAALLHAGWHYLASAVMATEVTIVTNFLVQERLVFHDLREQSRRSQHRFLAWFAFNNLETGLRLPFVVMLVEVLAVPSLLAQALTLALAFAARFAFVTRIVYRPQGKLLEAVAPAPVPVRCVDAMTALQVTERLRDFKRKSYRAPVVVALIPAHNEQDGIGRTIRSLLAQVRPVDFVIVMADNCTDATAAEAVQAGAWVIETTDNRAKKAGALNQGLEAVMPHLLSRDFVICQDADGELAPDFTEEALATFTMVPNLGGLSGAVIARRAHNAIESSQAIEYARGMRLMSRNGGRVHVLSGAATVFPVAALRAVAQGRGHSLPGTPGSYFMEDSLTEDYELTLAIKKLGYACSSTKRCTVVTDVMPTLKDLRIQRLRWFRGAMESMWLYGWSRLTHKIWMGIAWTFLVSLLFPLSLIILFLSWSAYGTLPDFRYVLLFPLFAAEGIVTARHIDRRARVLAVTFLPLWIYDNFMFVLYWRALFQALHQKSRVWIT